MLTKTHREKAWRELHKNTTNYIEQVREATSCKNKSCTATYIQSVKSFKLDEQDMWGIAGEVRTNS